jgi:hypothetical protein
MPRFESMELLFLGDSERWGSGNNPHSLQELKHKIQKDIINISTIYSHHVRPA